MEIFTTNHKLLLLLSSFILLSGCSTKENITVSQEHPYNNNYGVISDNRVDKIIAYESVSQHRPAEIDYSSIDPRYSTKLQPDPDAFLKEDWVQPEAKISYKYMDDPKFYNEDELPENKFKKGDVIVKLPANADKSLLSSIR